MTLYENALLCGGKYYVTNLSLYDNASNATLLRDTDGKQLNVTLSGRTLFKDGNWNTLCLPFDLSMDQFNNLLNGGTLMELDIEGTYDTDKQTGFDPTTGTLSLYFKDATEIKAGTPYIIKWPSGGVNLASPAFQSVNIDLSDETLMRQIVESADGKVQFRGIYSPITWETETKSILFLGEENKLYFPQPSGDDIPHLGAFRAYFQLNEPSGVREINLYFEDGTQTTGIIGHTDITDSTDKADAAWYSLDGVKLDSKPTQKGLYLHGGRKVVIK
jgi:hypothetical protein